MMSMYQVSFNSLQYLQRYAPDKLFIAKIRKGSNCVIWVIGLWFLHSALSLMNLYQCIKFYLITPNTFRDVLHKSRTTDGRTK